MTAHRCNEGISCERVWILHGPISWGGLFESSLKHGASGVEKNWWSDFWVLLNGKVDNFTYKATNRQVAKSCLLRRPWTQPGLQRLRYCVFFLNRVMSWFLPLVKGRGKEILKSCFQHAAQTERLWKQHLLWVWKKGIPLAWVFPTPQHRNRILCYAVLYLLEAWVEQTLTYEI